VERAFCAAAKDIRAQERHAHFFNQSSDYFVVLKEMRSGSWNF